MLKQLTLFLIISTCIGHAPLVVAMDNPAKSTQEQQNLNNLFFNAFMSRSPLEYIHEAKVQGPDLNALSIPRGQSPLHLAIAFGYNDVSLLESLITPENVNRQDYEGNTPLHQAAESKNLKVIKLLLEKGANANTFNKNCVSPLFNAVSAKADNDIIKLLITPETVNTIQFPPLDRAIINGSDALSLLIEAGATLTSRNIKPAYNNYEMLKTLITSVTPKEAASVHYGRMALNRNKNTLNKDMISIINNDVLNDIVKGRIVTARSFGVTASDEELTKLIKESLNRVLSKPLVLISATEKKLKKDA